MQAVPPPRLCAACIDQWVAAPYVVIDGTLQSDTVFHAWCGKARGHES